MKLTTLSSFFAALAVSGCAVVMPQTLERYPVDPQMAPPPPVPVTVPGGHFTPEQRPDSLTAPQLTQRQLPVELTQAYGPAPVSYMPPSSARTAPAKPARQSKSTVLPYQRIGALK